MMVADIKRAVADHYGLTLADLGSPSRAFRLAHPRQGAMTLAFRLTDHSKARIASFFDKRDHSTVFHACGAVARRQASSARVRDDLRRITLGLVTAKAQPWSAPGAQ